MSLEYGVLVVVNERLRGKGRAGGGSVCGCTLRLLETDVVGLCLGCLPLVRDLLFGAFGLAACCWDVAGTDDGCLGDNEFAGMGRSMTRRWRMKRAIGMLITTGSTANGRNWEL